MYVCACAQLGLGFFLVRPPTPRRLCVPCFFFWCPCLGCGIVRALRPVSCCCSCRAYCSFSISVLAITLLSPCRLERVCLQRMACTGGMDILCRKGVQSTENFVQEDRIRRVADCCDWSSYSTDGLEKPGEESPLACYIRVDCVLRVYHSIMLTSSLARRDRSDRNKLG